MRHIVTIAIKEIKQLIRDKRSFIFMLIFPLVLMGVLGTALDNAFNTEKSPVDMDVVYKVDADEELDEAFTGFADEVDDAGIYFQQAKNEKEGKQVVDNGDAAGYVSVDVNGIDLYLRNENTLESNILKSALHSFADSYNTVSEIIRVTPEKADVLTSEMDHDYIQEHAVDSDSSVGSMDYYAIVMTTMFILIGAMFSSGLIADEHTKHTDVRLMIAPITKRSILIGKVTGFVAIFSFFICVLVMFSVFVYQANWG